jgi:osmotically-inducible protein OsmY
MKVLWLLGVALLAGGCTSQQNANVRQNVRGMRQELDQARQKAQHAAVNQALEGKVKNYLTSRKGLNARAIDVEVKDGNVTLKGEVASPEQAALAEQATLEVEGVRTVTNLLMMRVPATGYVQPAVPPTGTAPAVPGR